MAVVMAASLAALKVRKMVAAMVSPLAGAMVDRSAAKKEQKTAGS